MGVNFPWAGVSPVPSLPGGRVAVVSSGYGPRGSGMHSGIDIMFRREAGEPAHGPHGTPGFFMPSSIPALSPLDGYVTGSEERFTKDGESRGWGITIAAPYETKNGLSTLWEVFINHIVKGTQRVREGDVVHAGQPLGEIGGSVGNQGPNAVKHVHLGVLQSNRFVDPEPYFKRWEVVPLASLRGSSWPLAIALGLAVGWVTS